MALDSRQAATTVHSPRNSAGIGLLAEYYILLSIATWLVCLRCYGRIRFQHGLEWDDISIVAALVCYSTTGSRRCTHRNQIFLIIGAVLLTTEVANGLGQHFTNLLHPESSELKILEYNTFFQMDNVLCTLLTKISISIYILRIKNSRLLRLLLWILMTLMSLATLTVIVVLSVSCVPLEALWTPSLRPHAKCLALKTEYNVAYVQSGFTIITDLFLTISPIVVLWNVRIKTGKKIRICILMSLGLIATISNALRNAFQPGLTSKDPTCELYMFADAVTLMY